MRIRCPSCSATYDVADALLDPPRTVRCARCAEDWMAVPVADDQPPVPVPDVAAPAAPEPVAEVPAELSFHEEPSVPAATPDPDPAHAAAEPGPDPEPHAVAPCAIERLSAAADSPPLPPRRSHLLTAAWAASFLLLIGGGAAAYLKRDALMRLWPASVRVYATIGLAPADGKPELVPGGVHAAPPPGPAKPAH